MTTERKQNSPMRLEAIEQTAILRAIEIGLDAPRICKTLARAYRPALIRI